MFGKFAVLMPVLLAAVLPPPVCGAGKDSPATPSRKPIVCKWTTLQGMCYYYDGLKVDDDQSMKNIISPLKDPEADRLLALSSNSRTAGIGFLAGGTLFLAGGLVLALDNYDSVNRSFNSTGAVGLVAAAAGLIGDYIGAFKLVQSRTSRFAAVQRYNAIAHGDAPTSWGLPERGIHADLLALKF